MRELVVAAAVDPRVRAAAAEAIAGNGCRACGIRRWLGNRFRFLRDPEGVELLRTPDALLDDIARGGYTSGDCDDAAVLGAALGRAAGLPARFVVFGWAGSEGPFTHVFAELGAGPGSRWIDLDVTRPRRRLPPTRTAVLNV